LCEKSPEYKKVEKYQSIPTRLMEFFFHFGKRLLKRGGKGGQTAAGPLSAIRKPLPKEGIRGMVKEYVCLPEELFPA
jgi:hypothetical protein